MKTFILTAGFNSGLPERVEIKADVFCRNEEFTKPGFDVKFTNMELVTTNDVEAKTVLDLKLTESSFKGLLDLVEANQLGLVVIDLNDKLNPEIELSTLEDNLVLKIQPEKITVGGEVSLYAVSNLSGDVTAETKFYLDTVELDENKFTPEEVGTITIEAVYGDMTVEVVTEVHPSDEEAAPAPESIVVTKDFSGDITIPGSGSSTYQFNAEVLPEGSPQEVEWSVLKEGMNPEGVSISNTGLLTVSSSADTGEDYKVIATSVGSPLIEGEITFEILFA